MERIYFGYLLFEIPNNQGKDPTVMHFGVKCLSKIYEITTALFTMIPFHSQKRVRKLSLFTSRSLKKTFPSATSSWWMTKRQHTDQSNFFPLSYLASSKNFFKMSNDAHRLTGQDKTIIQTQGKFTIAVPLPAIS